MSEAMFLLLKSLIIICIMTVQHCRTITVKTHATMPHLKKNNSQHPAVLDADMTSVEIQMIQRLGICSLTSRFPRLALFNPGLKSSPNRKK